MGQAATKEAYITYGDISKLSKTDVENLILKGVYENTLIAIKNRKDMILFMEAHKRLAERLHVSQREQIRQLAEYCMALGI
jgi:hypothetical protein